MTGNVTVGRAPACVIRLDNHTVHILPVDKVAHIENIPDRNFLKYGNIRKIFAELQAKQSGWVRRRWSQAVRIWIGMIHNGLC